MSSSFTTRKSFEKQGTGDNENTWGTTLNTLFDNLDTCFGRNSKSVAGSANVTLTTAEARYAIQEYTGALTGNIAVIVPTVDGWWIVYNNTSGAYTLTVKTSAGAGIAVTQGQKALLYCDGTNVVKFLALDDFVLTTGATFTGVLAMSGAALNEAQGTDIASASTVNLTTSTGNLVDVTGTTPITAITLGQGAGRFVRFTGILTLTNGASLVLPGGQNIITAAGDFAIFRGYASSVVRCVAYIPKNGQPLVTQQATIASATTTDLGSDISQSIIISGTTTITSFGSTAPTGAVKFIEHSGILTLTHNGTSLILPGAVNIITAAGDTYIARHEGSGNWRVFAFQRGSKLPALQGKQTIDIPYAAFYARTTNGAAAAAQTESSTNKVNLKGWSFDQSTNQYIQFEIPSMPKSWDQGTWTFEAIWGAASGTGDVIWGMQILALRDGDTIDTAFGSAVEVTDTLQATSKTQTSAESGAVTPGGTVGSECGVILQVYRNAAAGGDTLNASAVLRGIKATFSTNAGNDA